MMSRKEILEVVLPALVELVQDKTVSATERKCAAELLLSYVETNR